jgi:hypothetical protein
LARAGCPSHHLCEAGHLARGGRLTYDFSDPSHRSGLIDVLNTLLEGLLSSCFFPGTWQERVSRLRAFRSWIDHAHSCTPGLDGGFKPDGTMYHHNGPYALYGRDALSGSVPVVADLVGTTFALGVAGQKVLNAALDTQVLLANTLDYPLSQVGRQQTGTWEIRPLVNVFGVLGRSRLDGGDGYDEDRASMFRRLQQCGSSWRSTLASSTPGGTSAPDGPRSRPRPLACSGFSLCAEPLLGAPWGRLGPFPRARPLAAGRRGRHRVPRALGRRWPGSARNAKGRSARPPRRGRTRSGRPRGAHMSADPHKADAPLSDQSTREALPRAQEGSGYFSRASVRQPLARVGG